MNRYFLVIIMWLLPFNFIQLKAQISYSLIIKNVGIIDVKKGKVIKNQDVMISENRIVAIHKSSTSQVNAVTLIDGTGKYLIPGLWDMHTHNWWSLHFSNHYVANGVLGVRNMYTPMPFIAPLKDSIQNNLLIGPTYFAAGRVLEGSHPDYPDWIVVDSVHKIKPALDSLQMEGSDFVKIYNKIPRSVYFELLKEAKLRGLSVQGHLPMAITAVEASNAGQKSFEHLLGIPDMCTHDELFKNKHDYNWYAAAMKEDDYGILNMDETLGLKAMSTLKRNNTYVCPTLVVWYNLLHPDTAFENDKNLKKYPKEMTDFWAGTINMYRKKDSHYKQMAIKKYETLKKTTYLLYKAKVPLIAGTDAMNPYCMPGYSLHREFELLSECGIANKDILKMATINAAEFLGLPDHGEIKTGYVASMVLLNGNPLNNIQHTRNIDAVIIKGRVLDQKTLSTLSNE